MIGKGIILAAAAILFALPAMAQTAPANSISGDYVEFRNADVYTGPCFANGEVGLTGEEAVLAWHVTQGAWAGVPLENLSVVAVVRASATLGDPYANPLPARTVFLVDARANDAQRSALINFAQAQANGLLDDVVAVEIEPVTFTVAAHGWTTLDAGNLLHLATRSIGASDHFCHNEEIYYPPLSAHLSHAVPAVALDSSYRGNHLGITWDDAGRRSSFTGSFAE
ncbi:MAG: DUF1326 domain-containing protein [Candidatus Acidiferrales bacterium]